MIAYVHRPKFTYIYTPTHTYWMHHGNKKLGWESRLQRDHDRGYSSNVPDTLVNMLYGLPEDLRR
jgi:hypothetical protein